MDSAPTSFKTTSSPTVASSLIVSPILHCLPQRLSCMVLIVIYAVQLRRLFRPTLDKFHIHPTQVLHDTRGS